MHPTQDSLFIAAVLTCIFLAIIFLLLFWAIVHFHNRFCQLKNSLFESELEILKQERLRISGNIHDTMGSSIMTAHRLIEAVLDKRGTAAELLPDALESLLHARKRMRVITEDLDDEMIIEKGLEKSILSFVALYQLSNSVETQVHFNVACPLDGAATVHLFRLVQEMVINTIKHAQASQITIAFHTCRNRLLFHYADNDPGARVVPIHPGVGIRSMKRRVILLGGQLQLTAVSPVEYFFQIPIR